MTANSASNRLVAVGLLLTLISSAFLFGVAPIAKQFDENQRKMAERKSLLTQKRLLGSRGFALKEERDSLREDLAERGGFLRGESSELISATLQDRLKRLAARAGAALSSTQALVVEDDEAGFRKVLLRVTMTAEISAVQRILHELETSRPLLFIDNLDLRTASLRSARDEKTPASLQVRFDLYGFVRQSGEET